MKLTTMIDSARERATTLMESDGRVLGLINIISSILGLLPSGNRGQGVEGTRKRKEEGGGTCW